MIFQTLSWVLAMQMKWFHVINISLQPVSIQSLKGRFRSRIWPVTLLSRVPFQFAALTLPIASVYSPVWGVSSTAKIHRLGLRVWQVWQHIVHHYHWLTTQWGYVQAHFKDPSTTHSSKFIIAQAVRDCGNRMRREHPETSRTLHTVSRYEVSWIASHWP